MRLRHSPLAAGAAWPLAAALASLLCAAPTQALPLISEVLYDASGSDDGHVFVELHAQPGTSLAGWTLEGVNGADGGLGPVLTLSGVVPADGLFVVADRTGGGASFVAGADLLANFDLQNGPDSLVLRDATGTVLDALGYGVFGSGEVFAGEGAPAPDGPAGSSLARRFADVDTGDNARDFVLLAEPTPGHAPLRTVPEAGLGGWLCGIVGIRFGARHLRAGLREDSRARSRPGGSG